MKYFLLFLIAMVCPFAFSANTADDIYRVESIESGQAILSGKVELLQVGGMVYLNRPPYQFKITSIDKETGKATIALPTVHDLTTSNTVFRNETAIVRGLATKQRLLDATEE